MHRPQFSGKRAELQASLTLYRAQVLRSNATFAQIIKDSNAALERSWRILARYSDNAPIRSTTKVIGEPSSTAQASIANESLFKAAELKKGDRTMFNDEGWSCKAVVVEILSSTQAIVRVLEGRLAGEEVEAYFPNGSLASVRSLSVLVRKAKPKLVLIQGLGDKATSP